MARPIEPWLPDVDDHQASGVGAWGAGRGAFDRDSVAQMSLQPGSGDERLDGSCHVAQPPGSELA